MLFRSVIIPLAHPVRIEGDNNLKVLKALRSSFCAYEDKCHQTGSYVNLSDWGEKHINKGRLYSIEQSDVDLLQYLISVVCDYTKKKFDAKEIKFAAVGGDIKKALIKSTIKMFDACVENRNTTIYNRLWYLITVQGFGAAEIDKIRAGVSRQDILEHIYEVVRAHREWRL